MGDTRTNAMVDGLVGFLPSHWALNNQKGIVLRGVVSEAYPKGKYLVILFVNKIDRPGSQKDLDNLRVMYEGHRVLAYVDFNKEETFDQPLADAQTECRLNSYETLVSWYAEPLIRLDLIGLDLIVSVLIGLDLIGLVLIG